MSTSDTQAVDSWHDWRLLGVHLDAGCEVDEAFFVLGAEEDGDSQTVQPPRVELVLSEKRLELRIHPPPVGAKEGCESRVVIDHAERERSEVLLTQFAEDRSRDDETSHDKPEIMRQLGLLLWQGPTFSDCRAIAKRIAAAAKSSEGAARPANGVVKQAAEAVAGGSRTAALDAGEEAVKAAAGACPTTAASIDEAVRGLFQLWKTVDLLRGLVLQVSYRRTRDRYNKLEKDLKPRLSLKLSTARSRYLSYLLDGSTAAVRRTRFRLLKSLQTPRQAWFSEALPRWIAAWLRRIPMHVGSIGQHERDLHPLSEVRRVVHDWQRAEQATLWSEQPLLREIVTVYLRNLRILEAVRVRRLGLKGEAPRGWLRWLEEAIFLRCPVRFAQFSWQIAFPLVASVIFVVYLVSLWLYERAIGNGWEHWLVTGSLKWLFWFIVLLLANEYWVLVRSSVATDQRGAVALSHLFVRYDLGCIVIWTLGYAHDALAGMRTLHRGIVVETHHFDAGYFGSNFALLVVLFLFTAALLHRESLLQSESPWVSKLGATVSAARLVVASISIGVTFDILGGYGSRETHQFGRLLAAEDVLELSDGLIALVNHGVMAMAMTLLAYAILAGVPVLERR